METNKHYSENDTMFRGACLQAKCYPTHMNKIKSMVSETLSMVVVLAIFTACFYLACLSVSDWVGNQPGHELTVEKMER